MRRKGITLVEMLVAMAITLVMMAAVVTVFANVSSGIQHRRATIELGNQIRHVRGVLQRDLEGATCPALTWQRPESNHGYLEIIEGPYSDSNPSLLTDGIDDEESHNHELDPGLSIVPRYGDGLGNKGPYDGTLVQREDPADPTSNVATTLNGLGDYDDILALTVRNEEEPFTGNAPSGVRVDESQVTPFGGEDGRPAWGTEVIESPLAEVVWFAVENPADHEDESGFFGEPGMRTIYRRTLLIAPWLAPYRYTHPQTGAIVDTFRDRQATIRTEPGVLRILSDDVDGDDQGFALAALVAFQDRYDLSARVEWDPRLGQDGRWKIVANTLADLTKRENRYEHHYYNLPDDPRGRLFPFGMVSVGGGYGGSTPVTFFGDIELKHPAEETGLRPTAAAALGTFGGAPLNRLDLFVRSFIVDPANVADPSASNTYLTRPFAFISDPSRLAPPRPATARAILNDLGQVVHVIHGPAPLWGKRRGEDVMLTDALAFDLRVYDPGAPIFQHAFSQTVLKPGDPGWADAYRNHEVNTQDGVTYLVPNHSNYPLLGQGAYVDPGYGLQFLRPAIRQALAQSYSFIQPWFFDARWLPDRLGNPLVPGYSVYDTWSFHYEHNGINEDNDVLLDGNAQQRPMIDEGTNGFDDLDPASAGNVAVASVEEGDVAIGGVDDINERETTPPYDHPLRGIQIKLRGFERDSRQIREVTVNQHFVRE